MNPDQRANWTAAYTIAEYRVRLPQGEVLLQVGRHDARQDALLRSAGVHSHWALLTPCNPGSRRLDQEQNQDRLEQLQAIVQDLGLACFPAFNRDPHGTWPDEAGLLLADPAAGVAETLGRRFGQNAYLAGCLDQAPKLIWLIP